MESPWRYTASRAALLTVMVMTAPNASAIIKCRDARGHWHYGDRKARACGNRPAYRLNGGGGDAATIPASPARRKPQRGGGNAQAQPAPGHPVAALRKQRAEDRATLKILEHTLAHLESEAALAPHAPASLAREIRETEAQIETQRQALRGLAASGTTGRAGDQPKGDAKTPAGPQPTRAQKNGAS